MDYLSDERVKWTKEGATISLMEPVKYADDKYDKVFIKHMNGKVYRKYPDNLSPDDLISMAADLSTEPDGLFDVLEPDDLGAVIGVVDSFLLRIQTISLKYKQASFREYQKLTLELSKT